LPGFKHVMSGTFGFTPGVVVVVVDVVVVDVVVVDVVVVDVVVVVGFNWNTGAAFAVTAIWSL